jgi:hypothetical protein
MPARKLQRDDIFLENRYYLKIFADILDVKGDGGIDSFITEKNGSLLFNNNVISDFLYS